MISKKIPALNILIILAMLLSFTAVTLPAAPVQAAVTACHVTGATPEIIGAGGTVTVSFSATVDNEMDSYPAQAFMEVGSVSYYSVQDNVTGPGPHTLYITTPTNATAGTYTVYVTVVGAGGGSIRSDNSMTVTVDATKPTASVGVAESCWSTDGTTYNVTYTGNKSSRSYLWYLVELSVDNGASYPYTIVSENNTANATHTVNVDPTDNVSTTTFAYARMRIQVTDNVTNLKSDYAYSAPFYIMPSSGSTVITPAITFPNTSGLVFNGGDNRTITGTIQTQGPTASFMLSLFPNGDPDNPSAVYENITAGWKNVTISGTYPVNELWRISQSVSSSNCMIVLYARDCAGHVTKAVSPAFTIIPTKGVTVRIDYPTAGSVLYNCRACSSSDISLGDNITFSLLGGTAPTSTCTFAYSTDNRTWTNFSPTTVSSFPGGTNVVTFCHPGWTATTTGTTYYLKIMAVNNGIPTEGYSKAFTMKSISGSPTLQIVTPVGGESLTGGTLYNIQYKCTSNPTTVPMTYDIYFVNSGASSLIAHFTAANATGAVSTYGWAVNNVTASNCKIKIIATDICGNTVTAESPNAFSVTAGCGNVEPFEIDLYPGWNLISLPLIPISTDINYILSNVTNTSNINSVYYFTGGPSGTWKYYVPGVTNTITTMTEDRAYWINMKNADTLTIWGRKNICGGPNTPALPFYYSTLGWNLVGFKSTTAVSLKVYTAYNCGGSFLTPVYYFDGPTQTMKTVDSCDGSLQPGYGYWFYVTKPFGFLPGFN